MKKISLIILMITLSLGSFAQLVGELFQGTIKQGTSPNAVMLYIRPSASFNGQFSNVQFTVQIPSSIVPRPTISVKSTPLSQGTPPYFPAPTTTNLSTTLEGGFYVYSYNINSAGGAVYNFQANTEIPALELQFSGADGQSSAVRLAHLADGGSTGQLAFYIEVSGNDNTNYTSMFYGPGASNGGNYSAYSNIPIAPIVLPLQITNFNATRSNDNGLLSWTVENESPSNSHFDIERSLNGVSFTKVGQVSVAGNGSSSNAYNYTDLKITNLSHKGVVYYRLKQVDRDGQFVYSVVRSIRLDKGQVTLGLYPNPAKSTSLLTMDLPEAVKVSISISDASGKVVDKLEVFGNKGINQKKIDVSKLASGTYMLSAVAGDDVQTLSLVVSK